MYCLRNRLAVPFAALALLSPVAQPAATGQDKAPYGLTWEFKAVAFGGDEKENTKRLNELAGDGWEYVGALGAGTVAFKRSRALTAQELAEKKDLEQLQGTWTRQDVKTTFTVTRNRWVIKDGAETKGEGTLKLTSPGGEPRGIDLVQMDEKVIKSTYRVEGDLLFWTYVSDRPKGFPTQGAWKRAKP